LIRALLFQFALLCFATFVFDTLDACTRLARYVMMELLGWTTRPQAILATALTLALPALALSIPRVEFAGKPLPLYQVFWGIFGSSNQLLAALTLLGVTVWLARKGKPYWLALGPTLFMMTMTLWSLLISIGPYLALWGSAAAIEPLRHFQFAITVSLVVLTLWLIVEAFITWRTLIRPTQRHPQAALA
jgi:carbon starvation protein